MLSIIDRKIDKNWKTPQKKLLNKNDPNFVTKFTKQLFTHDKLELNSVLNHITTLLSETLSDFSIIKIAKNPQQDPMLFIAHKDHEKDKILKNFKKSSLFSLLQWLTCSNEYFIEEPKISPHLSERLDTTYFKSDEEYNLIKKLKFGSCITIPLKNKTTLGTLTLISTESRDKFNSDDLKIIHELAQIISKIIEWTMNYEEAKKSKDVLNRVFTIASHEIKTPLTTISLQINILKQLSNNMFKKTKIMRKKTNPFEVIHQQVKRINDLTESFLDISNMDIENPNLNLKEVNFTKLVVDTIESYCPSIPKDQLELTTPKQQIKAILDPFRISQVITNLLSNAIKYGLNKLIQISVNEKNDKIQFVIKDHGIGISEKDKVRIFECFFRATQDPNHMGHGIGLYLCHQIINAHQGTISVKSKLNQGTKFTVELPKNLVTTKDKKS